MAETIGVRLWRENLDLLTPPDSSLPPRQEPAEAILQLPFNARLYIRSSAYFIAKGSRSGAWTHPSEADLNPLKTLVDQVYEDLRKDGFTVPYEAVDAYFRQAYRDAEEWYARKRAKKSGEGTT
jgi:hypothetical protein